MSACQQDLPTETFSHRDTPFGEQERFMSGIFSFSLESTTHGETTTPGGNADLAILDLINNQRVTDRQDIHIGVYPDGRVDLMIQEATPVRTEVFDAFKDIPKSDVEPIYRTVVSNNLATMYSKAGKVIHQHEVDTKQYDALGTLEKLFGRYDWQGKIEETQAVKEDLGHQTYLIRTPSRKTKSPHRGREDKNHMTVCTRKK
jgi:hypothetical protein